MPLLLMKNVYKSEQRLCPIKCGNWRLGELYACDVVAGHVCLTVCVAAIFAKLAVRCLRVRCRCVKWASGKWTKFAYIFFCSGQDTCLLAW